MGEKVVTSTFGRQHIDFFFFLNWLIRAKGGNAVLFGFSQQPYEINIIIPGL